MYLEISGRQTGKTTRLVEAVEDWTYKHIFNRAIVVTVNPELKTHMRRLIRHNRVELVTLHQFLSPKFQCGKVRPKSDSVIVDGVRYINDDDRIFFDEFDFGKSDKLIPIYETGYYVTTPKCVRTAHDWHWWQDDNLLRLLVANNFQYKTFSGMSNFFNMNTGEFDVNRMNELRSYLGETAFRTQYLCEFSTQHIPQRRECEQPPRSYHIRQDT